MTMSTSLMFDRAINQMGLTQDRLSKTQMQLSTAKEILKPSDAPDKSAVITRLKSAITRQQSYLDTVRSVQDKLAQQETAAKSASNVITRLKELTVQAANDTYGPEDRKLIDVEVKQLRDQLLSLANTQDVNGNFIFSGARVAKSAFAVDGNGRIAYQGDQTINQAGVGDQRNVLTNRSGTNPFGMIIRTGQAAGASAAARQESLVGSFSDATTNLSTGDFSITLTTAAGAKTVTLPESNSSPQDIIDAINNQMALGVKAELYPATDGNSFQIKLTGLTGADHDFDFSTTLAGGLDFTTVQQAADATGGETRVGVDFFSVIEDLSAALQSNDSKNLQRAVGEIGALQDSMTSGLANIGASMNTLDMQQSLAEENQLRLKKLLSDSEDVDYTEAITKMNKEMLALEAAQSSFAKISQLNLFSYLR
jgi:flagellar hook-associated protein 3 FlgL